MGHENNKKSGIQKALEKMEQTSARLKSRLEDTVKDFGAKFAEMKSKMSAQLENLTREVSDFVTQMTESVTIPDEQVDPTFTRLWIILRSLLVADQKGHENLPVLQTLLVKMRAIAPEHGVVKLANIVVNKYEEQSLQQDSWDQAHRWLEKNRANLPTDLIVEYESVLAALKP